MIDEDKINKRASEELFNATQSIYNPEPSEEKKRDIRKQQLQKELNEIEQFEHRNDKIVEAQKKARLRKEVGLQMREQRKINQAVNNQFSQMSHTNKDGKLVYGS